MFEIKNPKYIEEALHGISTSILPRLRNTENEISNLTKGVKGEFMKTNGDDIAEVM